MNMMMNVRPPAPPSNDPARRSLRFRRLVKLFERDEIEAGVDALLSYLDARAADADTEANGDELDGGLSEDDFIRHAARLRQPACPIADPGEDDDDDGCSAGDDNLADWGAHAYSAQYGVDRGRGLDGRAGDGDDAEPTAWVEWQTRGRYKLDARGAEMLTRDRDMNVAHEDAEPDAAACSVDHLGRGAGIRPSRLSAERRSAGRPNPC